MYLYFYTMLGAYCGKAAALQIKKGLKASTWFACTLRQSCSHTNTLIYAYFWVSSVVDQPAGLQSHTLNKNKFDSSQITKPIVLCFWLNSSVSDKSTINAPFVFQKFSVCCFMLTPFDFWTFNVHWWPWIDPKGQLLVSRYWSTHISRPITKPVHPSATMQQQW